MRDRDLSRRADRRLRSGLVPNAIMRVLSESVEPMRMKDIHAEVDRTLGQPVSRSAVKNWLAGHTGGAQPLFVRLARGVPSGGDGSLAKCSSCVY